MNPITLLERLGGDNQFLSGGLVLMMLGTALSLAYRAVPAVWRWCLRQFTVSIHVRDEQVFVWLGDWIQTLQYGDECRRMSVDVEHLSRTAGGRQQSTRLVFAPGRGSHFFRFSGQWFWLDRGKEDVVTEGGSVQREFYRLRSPGRDPGILKDILRQASARAEERRKGKVGVYGWNRYGGWKELQLQRGRGLESIVLPAETKERLVEDLETFQGSRDWYGRLGVPYRRGYLFHGPPGCGKTSFAKALASHFGMSIYLVNLSSSGMTDETLLESLNTARPDSILLIEDIDAAFLAQRGREDASADLTFSGLLNAIDGVAAQEGRIVIMTTNHRERLDPALIRPGRVDVQQRFSLASPEQARELFLRFYPGQEGLADILAERVPPETMSVAMLQGMFLQARGRPGEAVRRVIADLGRSRPRWLLASTTRDPKPGALPCKVS